MKSLKIFTTICAVLLTCAAYAEDESPPVKAIQTVKNEAIDFDNLPQESIIGSLAECVAEGDSLLDLFSERIKRRPKLYPYSEGLAYVNGVLCHEGYYSRSIVYTVLDGPQYGLQTVLDYSGAVLYVNYDYYPEYTYHGVIFHHDYSDSEIITGSTQVIKFY